MTREEMRQALNAAPTATHYWYWCTRLRETDRIADIWTVGPDSEAARAWRGEGRAVSIRLVNWNAQCYAHAHERLYAETARSGTHRGADYHIVYTAGETAQPIWLAFGVKGLGLLRWDGAWPLAAVEEALRRSIESLPNPNYTPAVRRVVAWEVTDTGDMHRDKRTAYRLAAHNRMTSGRESGRRAWRRFCEHPLGHKRERRKKLLRDRYAMMLHHWDEKAGHRA